MDLSSWPFVICICLYRVDIEVITLIFFLDLTSIDFRKWKAHFLFECNAVSFFIRKWTTRQEYANTGRGRGVELQAYAMVNCLAFLTILRSDLPIWVGKDTMTRRSDFRGRCPEHSLTVSKTLADSVRPMIRRRLAGVCQGCVVPIREHWDWREGGPKLYSTETGLLLPIWVVMSKLLNSYVRFITDMLKNHAKMYGSLLYANTSRDVIMTFSFVALSFSKAINSPLQ